MVQVEIEVEADIIKEGMAIEEEMAIIKDNIIEIIFREFSKIIAQNQNQIKKNKNQT
jgi:hypothetical protein